MSSLFSNKYPIPNDFQQILHDFTKEIVRNKPKDILDFSIHYFYCLENNLKFNFNDNNHSTDIKQIENTKQEEIISNNKNNTKDREAEINTINEDNLKILEKINELDKKNDTFDKDEDTFSNISGSTDDKIGVKHFIGNIMEESKKCALMKEEKDK